MYRSHVRTRALARAASIALLMLLALPAPSATAAQVEASTTRASVTFRAKQPKGWSGYPSISASGRYVAFETSAPKVVKGDTNGTSDVFVRDRVERTTKRVSVSSSRQQGDGWSGYAAISGDGRFVAFTSAATNLVPGDANGKEDVFVHDRATGTTERVSVGSSGQEGNADSAYPALSADGRFVAFVSSASNLVEGDANGKIDVFVHDRAAHVTKRISVDSSGVEGNGDCDYLMPTAMSADGRFVAFASAATNLAAGDTNAKYDVFVHDRKTGTTTRASESSASVPGNDTSWLASMSGDGRFVVFESYASNLVANDANGEADVFVHNVRTGTTKRVSVAENGGEAEDGCYSPTISANGRFVAFDSYASNLVAGDENDAGDVFVHDRKKGTTRRVSVASDGREANGASGFPFISANGRFVAFQSDATDLDGADTNQNTDVYLRGPLP